MRTSTGVTILGVATIVCGVFELLWGITLTGAGSLSFMAGLVSFSDTIRTWGGGAFIAGLFGVVIGVAQIFIGMGLLNREHWAWLLAGISAALALIHPIVGLFSGNFWSIFGLIIPCIILYFLTLPDVKREFARSRV